MSYDYQRPTLLTCAENILGSMTWAEKPVRCYDEVFAAGITEEHFTDERHQKIFSAMKRLYDAKADLDLQTVAAELQNHGYSNLLVYLAGLHCDCNVGQNVDYHVKELKRQAIERSIKDQTRQLAHTNSDRVATDIRRRLTSLDEKIDELTSEESPLTGLMAAEEAAEDRRYSDYVSVPIGVSKIQAATGGLRLKTLNILAARPACGKTMLAVNIAYTATRQNLPVAFYTFEMPKAEIYDRLLSRHSQIPIRDFGPKNTAKARADLRGLPMTIVDHLRPNYEALEPDFTVQVRKLGVKLIVVDYIQQVGCGYLPNSTPKHLVIDEVCKNLKGFAIKNNVAVLALAQVRREFESRNQKEPMPPTLADLKDSGSIEQYADTIMFIHREGEEGEETYSLCLRKNRAGRTGDAKLLVDLEKSYMGDYQPTMDLSNVPRFQIRKLRAVDDTDVQI